MGAGNDALGRGRSQGKGSQAGHVKGAESWPGGQQAWKVIRLGLSSWGVTRGAELHELFPMLCLPRLVFSGCPHVPLALSQQQL